MTTQMPPKCFEYNMEWQKAADKQFVTDDANESQCWIRELLKTRQGLCTAADSQLAAFVNHLDCPG